MDEDFKIVSTLGSGSFGTVYKVLRFQDKKEYVAKAIRVKDLSAKEQLGAVNEVKLLAKIKSPFVVKYYDYYLDKEYLHIVMEYCNYGDLTRLIKRAKSRQQSSELSRSPGLAYDIVWSVMLQIILGLFYLHSEKILHRDLKSANVFLNSKDGKFEVKIGDLGVAKLLDTSTAYAQTIVGTPYYLSPELCADQPYRDKSDCWALGVILYECCSLRHPFDARHQAALIMKIIQAAVPALSAELPAELAGLTMWLLVKDPVARASTRDILNETHIRDKLEEFGLSVPEALVDCTLTNRLAPSVPAARVQPSAANSLASKFVAGLNGNRSRGKLKPAASQKALSRYQVKPENYPRRSVSDAKDENELENAVTVATRLDSGREHRYPSLDTSGEDYAEDFEEYDDGDVAGGEEGDEKVGEFTVNVSSVGYRDSLGGGGSRLIIRSDDGAEGLIRSDYRDDEEDDAGRGARGAECKEAEVPRSEADLQSVRELIQDTRGRCEEALGRSLFNRLYGLCKAHVTRPLHQQSEQTMRNNEGVVKELGDLLHEQLLVGAEVAFDAVTRVKVLLAMESELDRLQDASRL